MSRERQTQADGLATAPHSEPKKTENDFQRLLLREKAGNFLGVKAGRVMDVLRGQVFKPERSWNKQRSVWEYGEPFTGFTGEGTETTPSGRLLQLWRLQL